MEEQMKTPKSDLTLEKSTDEWPSWVAGLIGSWQDLPTLEEIRAGFPEDLPREPL
jgi:hypothetical protein